jgi:TonB-linked SusC/RagA family outer membrane protein
VAIVLALLFPAFPLFSQQRITGKILDAETNEVISGAGVSIQSSAEGSVSDSDGNFSLTTNRSLPLTLVVSSVGYKTQEIDVYDAEESVTILLNNDYGLLSQVVVIGYGTQKRTELTSAISTIPQDRLTLQVTPSVETALSGAVAGLNVTQTSGQPGATSNIRIRGGNSINANNDPLYVIDGFIVYNTVGSTRTGAGRSDAALNPLASINTADIESIEVLKDISATAIFGTRGANGVIIITTKKGDKGSNHVNYSASFGWQDVRKKVDFLDAHDWTELYNEIRTGEGRLQDLLPVPARGTGTDWQDAALQTGFTQTHQLSVNGGDEKSRYSISGNFSSQDGIVLGTDLKRYGGRVNLERDVFKKLRVGLNATGSFIQLNGLSNYNGNNEPNSWIAAINVPPIVSVYNPDGSFNYEPNILSTVIYDGKITNPISDLVNVKDLTENIRVLSILYAEYSILPELKLKANVGVDISSARQSYYAPSYTSPGAGASNGIASVGDKNVLSWQTEYTLNYNKTFNGIHSVTGLIGYTAQHSDSKSFTAGSHGFANDITGYDNLRAGEIADFPTSSSIPLGFVSVLGRASYSYKEKYNLTATFRTDGSSRFAPGYRWANFPSLGVSWNIDKESFFSEVKNISHLQVRLSGGTVGNAEFGDFRYISNIIPTTYYFNDVPTMAYIVENLSNNELRWEKTAAYNFGINLGLLQNRLTVTTDVYYKLTSDLLLEVPVEDVTGFTKAWRNAGSVSNKGVELEINARIFEKKHLTWNVSFNLAKNINRVESLGNVDSFIPSFEGVGTLNYVSPLIVKAGEPLGSFYGYKFAGIVQTNDDISKFPPQTTEALAPGVARYEDLSGPDGVPDGRVTEADRIVLGNSQPKFTGGLSSTLTFHRFDLFVALHGSFGNKLFNALRTRFEKTSTAYNSLAPVKDRWTPSNPSNTVAKASNSTSIVTDDRFIEDASFLKARNISLGYTLPLKQITKDTKIRFFISLQNFLTWTRYSGYDPESNRNGVDENNGLYQGVDFGTYPSSKTIQLGLSLTL